MSPPMFSEIGKEVKELFEKNFNSDAVNMNMMDFSLGPMKFQGCQKYSVKEGKMIGEVEGKYEMDGFTLVPKLTTESSLINYELKVNRPELKGINLVVTGTFNPTDMTKTYTVGANYCASDYNIELANGSTDPKAGSMLRASGVYNIYGWTVGVSGMVDPAGGKFSNTSLVGGYKSGNMAFFVNCDPQSKTITGSAYNVISPFIQTGLTYSLGSSGEGGQPTLACCGNYILSDGATLKARINANYLLGVAYTLNLKPGIKVTLNTEIDAGKMKAGGHKMGFGLEFA